jgi:hypothetical protein
MRVRRYPRLYGNGQVVNGRWLPDHRIVKPKPVQREHAEQVAFARYMALKFPWLLWHHSPMGGQRNTIVAAKLKASGASPGFPDIAIYTTPKNIAGKVGVAIELKAPKPHPSSVSRAQRAWLNHLEAQGWLAFVAYGFEEARAIVDSYYGGEP